MIWEYNGPGQICVMMFFPLKPMSNAYEMLTKIRHEFHVVNVTLIKYFLADSGLYINWYLRAPAQNPLFYGLENVHHLWRALLRWGYPL